MDANGQTTLWYNARIATNSAARAIIEQGAIVVRDDHIIWLGQQSELPPEFNHLHTRHDAGRQWITPGLIDCHTHLVHGGDRADEFFMRRAECANPETNRRDSDILATVKATCTADEASLLRQSARRLEALMAEGVTVVEIKSGYGLDLDSERKMLRVARLLAAHYPVSIYSSFLAAHVLPAQYFGRADEYIKLVCEMILPCLHQEGLIDSVDVTCGAPGFTLAHSEHVLATAQHLQLPVRMHVGQGSPNGSTKLAARYRALSVDHLARLDEADVVAMKGAGMVAVLLPGTFHSLHERRMPQIDLLRQYQVPIAIATDSNPETSPCSSLLLMLNVACTRFRLSAAEALSGVTVHAAQALGQSDRHGVLEVGRQADFVMWDVDSLAELAYWTGLRRSSAVVRHGVMRDNSSFV